jgi:hypothetical protein
MPMYKYVGNKVLTFMENTLIGTRDRVPQRVPGLLGPRAEADPLGRLTFNWHFDTQIIIECEEEFRIKEVPIPTYYGDEICRVNGVPYAMNCVREASSTVSSTAGNAPAMVTATAARNGTAETTRPRPRPDALPGSPRPQSSHQQISGLVRGLRLSPVLDVGCAQGMLGHLVAGTGSRWTGSRPTRVGRHGPPALPQRLGQLHRGRARCRHEYRLVVCGDISSTRPTRSPSSERLRQGRHGRTRRSSSACRTSPTWRSG